MLGTLLNGRYRIIRVLGSGGFGQTYVAEDIQQPSGSTYVVKQFKPVRQDADFLAIARRLFFTEVDVLRRLGSHPQIPSLIADFEENHEFYLVQDYVEGQAFSEELALVQRLTEADVVTLLRDVLDVLEFVHRHQVIHRDIKPSNLIRRQQDGKFVLIDFGAVKEIETQLTTERGQTTLTVAIGTQGYVPSEQLVGKPRCSSDLYALGMTAIQALTGLQPLQLPTHPDTAEVIWQDQATQVSPKLAEILSRMTRYHFSQRYQSAREVLQALESPTEVITNQTRLLPTRLHESLTAPLGNMFGSDAVAAERSQGVSRLSVGIISLAMTGLLIGIRQLGWLQPIELAMFDRMVQVMPDHGPDPRLLVVGITDEDIRAQNRFPLADRTVAQAIKAIKRHQPRAIGLDLLRDVPQEPGHAELVAELNDSRVVTIANLGTAIAERDASTTPSRASIPPERVGFNDFIPDSDGVIRRNLMFANGKTTTFYSFAVRLAQRYLTQQGISLTPNARNPEIVQFGKAVFLPLESHSGSYQTIDARGYQIMLKYRGKEVARQVSLSQILSERVDPGWIKDKVVLIGTTAASGKDLFLTPYSASEKDSPKMAGVLIHAQIVSQLISAGLDGRSLFWFYPEWAEIVWIGGWTLLGGGLAWYIQRPLILGLSGTVLLAVLVAIGYGVFTYQGWIPIAAPALAATATGGAVVAYRAYWLPRSRA